MSELIKRALFGAIYVAIILASILIDSMLTFALMGIMSVIGFFEMRKLTANHRVYYSALLGILGIWALSAYQFIYGTGLDLAPAFVGAIVAIFVQHIWANDSESTTARMSNSVLAVAYLALPLSLAPWFTVDSYGFFDATLLLGIFVMIWTNDTFAYLVGRSIGKHRLHERLSPKKSIEGFVGGMVFAILAGYLFHVYTITEYTLSDWIFFGLIASIGGTMGDLFESALKRSAKVKDSGKFIPGHGGLLDRIDSFLFVVPMVWLYLHIL